MRFPRNRLVAADEEHAQQVVSHFTREERRRRRVAAVGTCIDGALQDSEPTSRLPQIPHQIVVGHTIQPRAGIVWTALSRPSRERGQERTLDRVFDDVEMAHADLARQQRHQPAVFVPKEMFDEA